MATWIQKTTTSWEYIILRDTSNNILLMQGTTVPSGTAGYAKGCTFLDTDVGAGVSAVYFNKWTTTVCDFELAPVASTGTFTTITASSTIAAGWSITLGAWADLIGSATSDITINTDKFTVAWATWNTLVAWTFEATGASTLTGAVWCAASITLWAGADLLGSATSDITINTDKFTVAGATWNTVVGWTCDITGAVGLTASATLGAWADLIGSSTSDITINTNKFTVAGATGNTLVAWTFEATWASTLTWAVTGASTITSSGATSGIWYSTGAGWAVTQITNRSTGVTINKVSWTIQTDTTSLAAGASAEFTVTNSAVAIGDVVVVSQQSGSDLIAGVAGTTIIEVVTVAAGSFELSVNNNSSTTAETGAIIINFAVIKAVAA